MREILAERLLAKVMEWSAEDVAQERPKLQAMADFKYDEYQQFSPGMRFVESLARWLHQFKEKEQRRTAYDFVCKKLVFVSSAEMIHLVDIAFPDVIRPFLIQFAAQKAGIPEWAVKKIVDSQEYKVLLRRSLFLGLSDGARTDVFRRSNPDLSHEQVWQTYDLSDRKAQDMRDKLTSSLKQDFGIVSESTQQKFQTVFLLDDFSGSGISYFRQEKDETYRGKVFKIFEGINELNSPIHELLSSEELHVCLVLYIATEQACSQLHTVIDKWQTDSELNINYSILPVQKISKTVKLVAETDEDFLKLSQEYFDEGIINESYHKGKCQNPYLGFDECALPLVLTHNSPNNSLPLLWFEENRKHRGLFPRVSRH